MLQLFGRIEPGAVSVVPGRRSLSARSEGGLMAKKVISGLAILFVLVYVFEAPDDAGRALRGGFDSVVEFLGALVPE